MAQSRVLKQPHRHKEGKKNRKFGRNKVKCAEYRRKKKHERGHIRCIQKHILKYHDESDMVKEALKRYQIQLET